MLIGSLGPGPGQGLAGADPVLGEQRAEGPADAPRAGAQIAVLGREGLGGAEVALHLLGPALVGQGEALHEQGRRLERDESQPRGGAFDLPGHVDHVLEPGRHGRQRGEVGADPGGQAHRADPEGLGPGLLQALAAGVAEHLHGAQLVEDPQPVHGQAGRAGRVERPAEGGRRRVQVAEPGA